MGNICNGSKKDDIKPAGLPNHKRKGPTMVSYDFDTSKGQMRCLADLTEPRECSVQEEGKRVIQVKGLKHRNSSFS